MEEIGKHYLGYIKEMGGGFMFIFHPDPWGNDPIRRAYFSNGLKPPSRKTLCSVTVVQIYSN